jgi:hypothetical protein
MATYFVQKNGIYGHGVFWIGDDVEEGKRQVDAFAGSDFDKYHQWALYEFELISCADNIKRYPYSRNDADHELVYSKNGEHL